MAFINWGSHYSVGIPVMDSQHKRMADIVNMFQSGMRDGVDSGRLKALLDALAKVTVEHFQAEENLMEGIGFPNAVKHRDEHKLLTERLSTFTDRFTSEDKPSPADAQLFFRSWILDHIQKYDRDYGVFLYNQRAKLRSEVASASKEKTKEPVA